jgi:hypothetical protein
VAPPLVDEEVDVAASGGLAAAAAPPAPEVAAVCWPQAALRPLATVACDPAAAAAAASAMAATLAPGVR